MTTPTERMDLIGFGYAPGNYFCICSSCKEQFQGDKRALRCIPCAEKVAAMPPQPIPTERGLFERIESFLESLHPNSAYRRQIKEICAEYEQRLAAARREVERAQNQADHYRQENYALREQVFNPKIQAGYVAIPRKALFDALMLIDPPPFEHDGKAMVFKNPMAAEVLTRLSEIIRGMVGAPLPEKNDHE